MRSSPGADVNSNDDGDGAAKSQPTANQRARICEQRRARMAVARCDSERVALHGVFSAVQRELALLDRADAADQRSLVFRREFKAPLAT